MGSRHATCPLATATRNEPMDSDQRLRTPRSNCRSCRREHGTCAKAPFRQARCRLLGAKRSKLRSRQCLRGFLKGYEAALSMRGNRLPRDREGRALLPPREPPEEVARVDRKTMGQVLEACGARAPCQRILPAKDLRPVIPQCPVNPEHGDRSRGGGRPGPSMERIGANHTHHSTE